MENKDLTSAAMQSVGNLKDRRHRRRKDLRGRRIQVELNGASGFISDLSEGGIAVRTAAPLALNRGERMHLAVADSRRPIQAGCELAWTDAAHLGLRFLVLSESSQRSIHEWLRSEADTGDTVYIQNPPRQAVKLNGTPTAYARELTSSAMAAPRVEAVAPAAPVIAVAAPEFQPEKLDPDSHSSLALLAHLAMAITSADGVAIALGRSVPLTCMISIGRAPEAGTPLWRDSGISGECLRTAALTRCEDTHADPRIDAQACRALGVRSLAVAPVICGNACLGVVEIISGKVRAFDPAADSALALMAELAGRIYYEALSRAQSGELSAANPAVKSFQTFPSIVPPRLG